LNGVSLHIDEKEFVAVMGPSGCGNSTLLNILGLLDNPTAGNYYLAGTEIVLCVGWQVYRSSIENPAEVVKSE